MQKLILLILFLIFSTLAISQTATELHSSVDLTNNSSKIDYDDELIDKIISWFKTPNNHTPQKPLITKSTPVIIGLALGSGAAKGFAHIEEPRRFKSLR